MQIIDALKKRYQNKTCSKTCPLPNRRSGFGAAASLWIGHIYKHCAGSVFVYTFGLDDQMV